MNFELTRGRNNEPRVLRLDQGVYESVDVTPLDDRGEPVDVANLGYDPRVTLSSTAFWGSRQPIFVVDGRIDDDKVFVDLTPEHTSVPGIHTCSLTIFVDDQLIAVHRYLLEISAHDLYVSNGPLSIAEVRLHLRDTSPEVNYLLDDMEWSDAEIAAAIRWPVDQFNERPPPLDVRFTVYNFPYRYHWCTGASAMLMRTAAAWYRRNAQNRTSGGISINDRQRAEEYERIAAVRWQEYVEWCDQIKLALNAEAGFGIFGSELAQSSRVRRW